MANIKYVVELTLSEREALLAKINKGTLSARANCKARILFPAHRRQRLNSRAPQHDRPPKERRGLDAVFAGRRADH